MQPIVPSPKDRALLQGGGGGLNIQSHMAKGGSGGKEIHGGTLAFRWLFIILWVNYVMCVCLTFSIHGVNCKTYWIKLKETLAKKSLATNDYSCLCHQPLSF